MEWFFIMILFACWIFAFYPYIMRFTVCLTMGHRKVEPVPLGVRCKLCGCFFPYVIEWEEIEVEENKMKILEQQLNEVKNG